MYKKLQSPIYFVKIWFTYFPGKKFVWKRYKLEQNYILESVLFQR